MGIVSESDSGESLGLNSTLPQNALDDLGILIVSQPDVSDRSVVKVSKGSGETWACMLSTGGKVSTGGN